MKRVRTVIFLSLFAILGVAPVQGQEQANQPSYDLLFRTGTLDALAPNQTIVYSSSLKNQLKPETDLAGDGQIVLSLSQDEGGDTDMAWLRFEQGKKYRTIGEFPANIGNPLIMYFVETVLRDMAQSAGGSPFYIRNRLKEELLLPTDVQNANIVVEGKQVAAKVVTMHPFKKDPNAKRMRGFADLELKITVSEAVPGWYQSLEALVPKAEGEPIYTLNLQFEKTGSKK